MYKTIDHTPQFVLCFVENYATSGYIMAIIPWLHLENNTFFPYCTFMDTKTYTVTEVEENPTVVSDNIETDGINEDGYFLTEDEFEALLWKVTGEVEKKWVIYTLHRSLKGKCKSYAVQITLAYTVMAQWIWTDTIQLTT